MRKKSTAKRKKTGKSHANNVIGTMTGGVIARKISVKGNWTGQYNDYRQQIAQISTPKQFVAEAEKLQSEIAEAKSATSLPPTQLRRIEAVEGDVNEVVAEAKKDSPNPRTMADTLKTAAETMEGVGKAVEAAQGAGEKIDKLARAIDWARLAFGLGALADTALKVFHSIHP